ncbi:potassium channel family protein [Bosea sp. BK604]|uniref:potassium channel family protein n=1 Tax=Bosea sp. BK604 TaxID=2512180 RepID=UPI0010484344|nr:potassium channel family protein [Bosea sp. BK604]TCR63138.1 voltage-gated potassium channel [Bosea sp. BK604]
MSGARALLRSLYFGDDRRARRFRYGLVVFDLLTIGLFILSASVGDAGWIVPVDFALGVVLAVELAARLYAGNHPLRHLLSLSTAADLVVIGSLLLPALTDNLGFLRVVRALRLLRSYHLLRDLRSDSPWFRRYEDVIQGTLNLTVFIFVVTSLVYVSQNDVNPQIAGYIDALYFTITTLTTTGFGDITLVGPGGRLISVVIMVVGVALFLRLLQAVFRPNKIRFECPDCALQIHDIDAVHCKHCGRILAIPDEGAN